MEEEIDLRVYVEVLLRHWMWILGLAVGAAAVAVVISLLLPPVYEASAVVLVTEPRYQMEFDSRFSTEQAQPAYKAFPTLATSDGVLGQVVEAYVPPPEAGLDKWTLSTLSGMAEASSGGDPSLVLLKVTSRFPGMAADLANRWAEVLVETGNEVYGESQGDLTFFEKQLDQAQEALASAEAALIEFESRNQSSTVRAQLDSLRRAQADYLADQRDIAHLLQNIQGLRQQLAGQPLGRSASLADSLTVLLLQIKAFNAQASTPLQLQVESADAFSDQTPSEQIALLDNLVVTLENKSAEIDTRLSELEPQILALQAELQTIDTEGNRLTRARDLARETYVTLARKVDEIRIAVQEESGTLQVGSYAAVPEKPVGPRKKLIVGVAGMLGLLAGIAGAFVLDYWRRNPEG
ncbi:MAG: GumC family protein [Anaerolineae bacterium]